jgi:hypothetical protein
MDWKQFTAQIVSSIAYPLSVIIILLIFKTELTELVRRLAHLRYKDLELEFDTIEQLSAEVREEVHEKLHADLPKGLPAPESTVFTSLQDQAINAADRAPWEAILLAWSGLEAAIASAVARLEILPEPLSHRDPMHNITLLANKGGVPESQHRLLHQMRKLRNQVAHQKDAMFSITKDQALGYARAAKDMIQYLEQIKGKGEQEHGAGTNKSGAR